MTNCTTTASFDAVQFSSQSSGSYITDFYVCDTTGTINTGYLGDINVVELYPNAAGVNSAWSVNQASFALTGTGTLTSGTSLVYNGTITNGATPTNAWQGWYFTITGYANTHNNGTFLCSASTATTLTLLNTDTSATGAVAGATATAAFQNPVQIGIHGGYGDSGATTNVGTRPPSDVTGPLQWVQDSVTNDLTDFGHQALSLTGTIAAVAHVTYARKSDAGTRQMAQICLSSGTQETGSTITLSSGLSYYRDIIEVDPNAPTAQFGLSAFNAATFGWKEIT